MNGMPVSVYFARHKIFIYKSFEQTFFSAAMHTKIVDNIFRQAGSPEAFYHKCIPTTYIHKKNKLNLRNSHYRNDENKTNIIFS